MHWYEAKHKATGQTNSAVSQVCRPEKVSDISKYLEQVGKNGIVARGAGSSYADQTLNSDGAVMHSKYLDCIRSFDPATGELICESGVTLQTITELYNPQGFMLATATASGHHTIGGAISSNILGLNSFKKQSFAKSLNWIEVVLSSGETVRASTTENQDLFKSVIGGMGLVGFISLVSIKLIKRPEENVLRTRKGYSNLDSLLEALQKVRKSDDFCLAWIDTSARGDNIGRSVLKTASFTKEKVTPTLFSLPRFKISLPEITLKLATLPFFKKLRYRFCVGERRKISSYTSLLYSSDNVRIISQKGVYQVLFSFPEAEGPQAIRNLLTEIARTRIFACRSFLTLTKDDTLSYLGFAQKGYIIGFDFVRRKGMEDFLSHLFMIAGQHKGRISLQKDALLETRHLSMMYKNLEKFVQTREKYNPNRKFDSDLGRRFFAKEKNNEQ